MYTNHLRSNLSGLPVTTKMEKSHYHLLLLQPKVWTKLQNQLPEDTAKLTMTGRLGKGCKTYKTHGKDEFAGYSFIVS